jgi:hypothetical protein
MMMKKVHGSWFLPAGRHGMVHGVLFFLVLYATCFAQPISSSELINNAKQYDGKTVVYKGEVIGDVMRRGNYAWINANDGENAIGIWLPVNLTKEIAYTGSYKSIGDEIEITGVFHRACPEHGGDLDIHAQVMRKIDSGKPAQDKLNTSKRNQAIVLLGILGLLWILTLFKHK